jgi:hypothetical protein
VTRSSRLSLLEEQVALLLRHFGAAAVRQSVDEALKRDSNASSSPFLVAQYRGPTSPSESRGLQAIRESQRAKYELLSKFRSDLIDRKILPESQDILRFAQTIGLKQIRGRTQRDMIPSVVNYLVTLPMKKLRPALENASTISEDIRRQGYTVLTKKLLGDN